MAITLRATKGSPLTHAELDENFTTLDSDINQTLLDALALADSALDSALENFDGGGMGATGGSTTSSASNYVFDSDQDQVFYINETNIRHDFIIDSDTNVMCAGPITVDSASSVTVPINSTWVIL